MICLYDDRDQTVYTFDPEGHGADVGLFAEHWPDTIYFDTAVVDEPVRCEADHSDGGVCGRLLWSDGTCPGEAAHLPATPCPCGEPSSVTTRDGTVGGTRWCLTCARRRWHERDYWRDDER